METQYPGCKPLWPETFQENYLKTLTASYRSFYDDFHEYGNPLTATKVIYFIPGINGTPGQIRFALPAITRMFGVNVYIKCLYLPEFSANNPVWEKYTIPNIIKKKEQIIADLTALAERFADITVVASSNGFYDFLHASPDLPKTLLERCMLFWTACAPDHFEPSPWEKIFYKLSGFTHNNHAWVAFPNNNLLKKLNPETSTHYHWQYGKQKKVFFKDDLESRFPCGGLWWGYASIGCFNACLRYITAQKLPPLSVKAYVLAATNDGYWQGKPQSVIQSLVDSYLTNNTLLFKDSSHLWVVTPEHVAELIGLSRSHHLFVSTELPSVTPVT